MAGLSVNKLVDGNEAAIFELHEVSQTRHKLTEEFEINSHKMKLAEQEYTIERLEELKDNGILILN